MLLFTRVAQWIPFYFTKVPPGLKKFGMLQVKAFKIGLYHLSSVSMSREANQIR